MHRHLVQSPLTLHYSLMYARDDSFGGRESEPGKQVLVGACVGRCAAAEAHRAAALL